MASKKKAPKASNQYLRYSGLAFQMIFTLLLAVWGGRSLDSYLELGFPVFTLIFILFGLVGAMISLVKNLPKY